MMSLFIMIRLLVNFIAVVVCIGLSAVSASDLTEGLKWKAVLCCDQFSTLSKLKPEEQCHLLNASILETSGPCTCTNSQQSYYNSCLPLFAPGNNYNPQIKLYLNGHCLDIQCWLEGEGTSLTCNAECHKASASEGQRSSGPHQLLVQMDVSDETKASVECAGADSVSCSVPLHRGDANVSLIIIPSFNGTTVLAPMMQIRTRQLYQRPDPPVDLHYNVTAENEGVFQWSHTQPDRTFISCEIRYSSDSSLQQWEVVKVKGRYWVPPNELSFVLGHTVQVRCQNGFSYWSDWSQPFSQTLGVSYDPAEVFTTPGSDVTVRAILHKRSWNVNEVVWMLNSQVKIPKSQYTVINQQMSAVTLKMDRPGFDSLLCCYPWRGMLNCSIAYAKIYTEGLFDAEISCQSKTTLLQDTMTCEWKKSDWSQVRLLYRVCSCKNLSLMENTESSSMVKECTPGAGDHRECTLSEFSLYLCYKIWLEVEGGQGKVISTPVYVDPVDIVKPSPPSVVKAFTLPNNTLSVQWTPPPLPLYAMQYKLRIVALRGIASTQWKDIGPLVQSQAEILLEDSCVPYKVEVSCKRLEGSGYWSDWSKSYTTILYNTKAPQTGPDYWRIIQEDPSRNMTNVTLLFKNPVLEDPDSCVEGLLIEHQSSDGVTWSNETALEQFHSFKWGKEGHVVTVRSRNALGTSMTNKQMIFLHQPKRSCVDSFSVVANASCVHLSWSLLSDQTLPLSFVIEWLDLRKESQHDESLKDKIQWIRVQSTIRDVSLCRRFYGTEEFILYPVFENGEGEPVRCKATRSDPAPYILLLIIAFLSLVLFVTLMISQNHVRKLMWKDVPNPNNCSWAKEIDFKQIETIKSLFPHSEFLTSYPLLMVSENVCEVEIIDTPALLSLECEKDGEEFISSCLEHQVVIDTVEGGSTEALSLKAQSSGQSSVTYSTILQFHQSNLLQKPQESLSSSSDEGNFSANNSEISGSFPERLCDLEGQTDKRNSQHSCSYNSVEEFSDSSEHDYEASESTHGEKVLYYLKVNEEGEKDELDEVEDEDGRHNSEIFSSSFLESQSSKGTYCRNWPLNIPLYLPQFGTNTSEPS